ncbi:hypothetical protein GPY51_12625 [Photorhabdus laumondii subsp. laumondii]|uniref:Uncharacterized protein n=1 Tax=Photorhabdus laumondii subsp. laumondii TaxID=141679 RepID=A0A6L9JT23_PHOLM|nr:MULTISPECIES: hypothetical protein [Photorhabdus]MCC8382398.1 hypothetical protein [Photorhabdus laumondii]MCC8411389.1 hypothetical protein [Photorhabdus laumondii]NDK95206.1 hypothetical protein [Photorhabdus laumondii subsp. laumondii]NDL21496.1 hypothetical protein [Photorhabdus laumondii subsp. laumondii]NDL30464.1 hypothetical protein [Photorhabdus laumondii subsp. laumondii]
MSTRIVNELDPQYVVAEGEKRAIRTIKLFISLGFIAESGFLLMGLILFPDNGPLVWRLVWALGLCGIGMGAAVGGLTYLVSARFTPGSTGAYIMTAVSSTLLFSVCQTLCWGLDHNVGLNYWGSIEMPLLFLIKGYTAALIAGILGSFLLNSVTGARFLARLKVF